MVTVAMPLRDINGSLSLCKAFEKDAYGGGVGPEGEMEWKKTQNQQVCDI